MSFPCHARCPFLANSEEAECICRLCSSGVNSLAHCTLQQIFMAVKVQEERLMIATKTGVAERFRYYPRWMRMRIGVIGK